MKELELSRAFANKEVQNNWDLSLGFNTTLWKPYDYVFSILSISSKNNKLGPNDLEARNF
jgi:hypothetical protein